MKVCAILIGALSPVSALRPSAGVSRWASRPSHYAIGPPRTAPQPQTRRTGVLEGLNDLVQTVSSPEKSAEADLTAENEEFIERCRIRAGRINNLEKDIEGLSDAGLRGKTKELQQRLATGASLDDVLEEAFAVVREAAWRVLEMRHYDVQLIAGMVLQEGRLAEMATGEGKTLAATLPTYLNALEGQGALVVTANEYLARRDAETVGQVHRFLGLTVGLVQSDMEAEDRRDAYEADVTYITNAELGFDFLRDNLALSPEGTVQHRTPAFCLVDECDSILIDEARTPLIISKQVDAPKEKYEIAAQLAAVLKQGTHYDVDEKGQQIQMTDTGFKDAERVLGKSMFNSADPWAPFVMNAIKAKALFEADVQYIVKGNEIAIVDTFTGRVMEGRRWSDGVHQSIEAKEGIAVSTESQVIATVTYQSLFRTFSRLCGMTGTAMSDAKEFRKVYGLAVTKIPTALPVARRDYPDVVFKTNRAKMKAMLSEVARVHEAGRPLLIGTTSVQDSEDIASQLRERNITARVLNAKPENVDCEGEVISQAGRLGAVTVATNMAGRGTDILLGGSAGVMTKLRIRDGLVRAGCVEGGMREGQGTLMDDGFYPIELSPDAEAAIAAAAAALLDGEDSDGPLPLVELEELVSIAAEKAPIADPVVLALRKAYGAVRGEFNAVVDPEKEAVRKLGGLYVVGTERHESARIDNQLRGRAGRQGDPGASRFFLSLDDKTLRTFGADRMKTIMDSFRVSEDIPLEAKMVSDAIDKVQNKVEEFYSEIRSQVFTFDEVLATQRDNIYSRRAEVLAASDEEMLATFTRYSHETAADILVNYVSDAGVNGTGLQAKIAEYFPNIQIDAAAMDGMSQPQLETYLNEAINLVIEEKRVMIEGWKAGQFARVAKYLTLVQIDNNWSEHLRNMNFLKESVILRKYQGRDVLQEYVTEGVTMFQAFLANARRGTTFSLFMYQPPAQQQEQ